MDSQDGPTEAMRRFNNLSFNRGIDLPIASTSELFILAPGAQMRFQSEDNSSSTRRASGAVSERLGVDRSTAYPMSSPTLPSYGVRHAVKPFTSETIKETIQAMLKTCVAWAKPALAAIAVLALFQIQPDHAVLAQSSDPSFLPRLSLSDLQYMGGFRLPSEGSNGDTFEFGGRPIAFNPANNSLFVGSRRGRLAEVSIPALSTSSDANALTFASYLQGFSDPTEGHLSEVGDGVGLSALIVQNSRIYGTASWYYDAMNAQRVSHYSRSVQLNQPSFSGWSQVWDTALTGYVSGFMSLVPSAWQAKLGGTAMTGQCCIPIVSRTSLGPSGFAFDLSKTGQSAIPAAPLVYYPGAHPTLGQWESTNEYYGIATGMGGVAIIAGTRTALYIGRNGIGPACYGTGTGYQNLHGTEVGDGSKYCYDPTDGSKGNHAYPYRYQIWAYDLNDLAAVKAGTKQPWDVFPYDVWPITFPTPEVGVNIGGVGYDPARQIVYVSQMGADQDGYAYRPIIHAFHVNAAGDGSTPTTPTTPSTVTYVSMTANVPAPQKVGATVNFQAAAAGGATPRQYKWLVSTDGVNYSAVGGWGTSTQFAWTPTTANAQYKVRAWARSATSTVDQPEAMTSMSYPIDVAAPTERIASVAITANKIAPQAPGTAIGFTATVTGGLAPYQYKWWLFDGTSWSVRSDWSAQNTFTWTPSTAGTDYKVGVWARSAGVTVDSQEGTNEMPFPISGAAAPSAPKISMVAISANKVAPQTVNTAITFSATVSGGVSPYQYKWLVFDGASWAVRADWSSQNSFTWTPGSANSGYRVAVWARSSGVTADAAEGSNELPFAITAAATPPPTAPKISSVTLGANKVAPQPAGSAIVFSASAVGGTAPYQYKWFVYEGGGWTVRADWSSQNSFTWTPATAGTDYKIGVWARSAGVTSDAQEASAEMAFVVNTAASATAPKVSSVTISSNHASPQPEGKKINWNASASGGTGPLQYRWSVHDGIAWTTIGGWTNSSTFQWSPTASSKTYQVSVGVRSAGNNSDTPEATDTKPYTITPK